MDGGGPLGGQLLLDVQHACQLVQPLAADGTRAEQQGGEGGSLHEQGGVDRNVQRGEVDGARVHGVLVGDVDRRHPLRPPPAPARHVPLERLEGEVVFDQMGRERGPVSGLGDPFHPHGVGDRGHRVCHGEE